MTVTEDRRIALLEAAQGNWGRDVAITLMEMLPPSGWGDVATRQQVDGVESRLGREMELRFQVVDQRFDAIDQRFTGLETSIDQRFDAIDQRFTGLETSIDQRFSVIDQRFGGMTTAINTTIDAKIAESQRAIIQWTVGTMIALVSACLAIAGALVALR